MSIAEQSSRLQERIFREVEPGAWPDGVSPFNCVVVVLILIASGLAVIETEASLVHPVHPGSKLRQILLGLHCAGTDLRRPYRLGRASA